MVTLDSLFDEICNYNGMYNQQKRNTWIINECKLKRLTHRKIAMLFDVSENRITQIYRKYRRS